MLTVTIEKFEEMGRNGVLSEEAVEEFAGIARQLQQLFSGLPTLRRLKPELAPEWASEFFKCAVVHLGLDDDGNIGIFFRRSDLSFRENEKAAKWLAEYLGKPLSNPSSPSR